MTKVLFVITVASFFDFFEVAFSSFRLFIFSHSQRLSVCLSDSSLFLLSTASLYIGGDCWPRDSQLYRDTELMEVIQN